MTTKSHSQIISDSALTNSLIASDARPSTFFMMRTIGSAITGLGRTGGNFTTGCRWQVTASQIIGIRFTWCPNASARTIKLSVWNDVTTSQLGTVSVSVPAVAGIYEGYFASPIDVSALAGVDLVTGMYETTGVDYTNGTSDTSFNGLMPFNLGGGLQVRSTKIFSAGDARPTSVAGTQTYYVEPILVV